jgi:hypothetical protein
MIAWFRKISPDSVLLVGKKALELNGLYEKDYPISPGFIITTDAYREFYSLVENRIENILKEIEPSNDKQIQGAANKIQRLILSTKMPLKMEEELAEAYDSMDIPISFGKSHAHFFLDTKQKAKVVVRSSPVALKPEAISAGRFATYLNVEGIEQLKRAVKACWASVFTSQSLNHRIQNGFSSKEVYNAVLIQKMVQSEKSGMIYTTNPIDGNSKEIVIQAIRGYSIGLGEIQPNVYVVDKDSNSVIKKHEIEQKYGYFGAEKGRSVKKELSYTVTSRPLLSDLEMSRIINIAKDLEMEMNRPLKIEFALEDERAFITDLKEIKIPKEVEMKKNREDEDIEDVEEEPEETESEEEPESSIEEDEGATEDTEESTEEDETSDAEEETEDDEEVEDETDDEEPAEDDDDKSDEETEEAEEDLTEDSDDDADDDIGSEEKEDSEDDDEAEEPDELSDEEDDTAEDEDTTEDTEEIEDTAEDEESAEEDDELSDEDTESEAEEESSGLDDAELKRDEDDDDEPEQDKEQRLKEVFEDYSDRINQLLAELKEESLKILRN